jgi:FtsZ-binding cell division protein ZapB
MADGSERAVPDSIDHFQKLEEKLLKAIELFKRTQAEKRALGQDVDKLRIESKERVKLMDTLERELVALRREREEVRVRIEKLLERIDALTGSDSEG